MAGRPKKCQKVTTFDTLLTTFDHVLVWFWVCLGVVLTTYFVRYVRIALLFEEMLDFEFWMLN